MSRIMSERGESIAESICVWLIVKEKNDEAKDEKDKERLYKEVDT